MATETAYILFQRYDNTLSQKQQDLTMHLAGTMARFRTHKELSPRHHHRVLSEANAAADAASSSGGLRSLLHTNSAEPPPAAVIAANSAVWGAGNTSSLATVRSPTLSKERQPSSLISSSIRSLAAAFEAATHHAKACSSRPSNPAPAAAAAATAEVLHPDDCSDTEADVAVMVAARSGVKQLTATWEIYSSAGGSVPASESSSPSASFTLQHSKPISRPLTPAAAPANPSFMAVTSTSEDPLAAAAAAAAVAASRASAAAADPAAAALLCWRQESGQLGPMLDLLVAPAGAAAAGPLSGAAADACGTASAATSPGASCAALAPAAVTAAVEVEEASEQLSSALCRAAVWVGLGYYLLTVA